MKVDAARWRREFEIPSGTVFLNHASFGPVPKRGRRAVEEVFRRQAEFKGKPEIDLDTFSILDASRRMFAKMTGAAYRRVAFAPNASYGINSVLHGLSLKPGDRILFPENEFPAVVYAVRGLSEQIGTRMIPIACRNGSMDLGSLESELKSGAALLAMSWVQFYNGFRNELRPISRLCHEHGCFLLVDVTQGAGAIPLNMKADELDAIACGTQKWLLGQTGAGFFAVSPQPIRPVRPPYTGWLGYDWGYSWKDLQRHDRPPLPDGRNWEVGTYAAYSVRLAHAGLSILSEFGIRNVYYRLQMLHSRLIDGLEPTEYRPVRSSSPRNRSGIVSFSGPKTADLHERLETKRIFVSLREGNIRVSPHFYNTESEIDWLVHAVVTFGKTRKRK